MVIKNSEFGDDCTDNTFLADIDGVKIGKKFKRNLVTEPTTKKHLASFRLLLFIAIVLLAHIVAEFILQENKYNYVAHIIQWIDSQKIETVKIALQTVHYVVLYGGFLWSAGKAIASLKIRFS